MQSTEPSEIQDGNQLLAAMLEITFDGQRYAYRQYRYDHFDDAVRYARACQSMPNFKRDTEFRPNWLKPFTPGKDELSEMARYGVTYQAGRYVYGAYRYDQLCHAIMYAKQRSTD